MKTAIFAGAAIVLGATLGQAPLHSEETKMSNPTSNETFEQVTLGSGCFWCTEAVFQQLKGVKSAVSGYSGGQVENPSYEQV
jgi:peptide-methionine (S)-S-oxide reductase